MPTEGKGPKDWSPREVLFDTLRRLAPLIAISVNHVPDPNFTWDGDGPDPREEGFEAYDVDVTARAVVKGREREGKAYLGGVYDKPGEVDIDVHGYLPQMLVEAVKELGEDLPPDIRAQQGVLLRYLKELMQKRYDAQSRRRP